MAKRTKFSKFRSLYDVIENLLDTYTHEGVVEILAESYDLELSVSTLRSYLYRYKKQSKELSVATDNSNSALEVRHDTPEQNLPNSQDGESIQEDVDSDDDLDRAFTHEELDAALEEMKRKVAMKENSSLLDRVKR